MSNIFKEIDDFRKWATTADMSFGEWETNYPHWDRIYSFVKKLINEIPVSEWNQQTLDGILYILARDNECELIIETLITNPKQLLSIAKYALSFSDQDARWQIAFGLGEIKGFNQERQILLEQFLTDESEYVRRRASIAYDKLEV